MGTQAPQEDEMATSQLSSAHLSPEASMSCGVAPRLVLSALGILGFAFAFLFLAFSL